MRLLIRIVDGIERGLDRLEWAVLERFVLVTLAISALMTAGSVIALIWLIAHD